MMLDIALSDLKTQSTTETLCEVVRVVWGITIDAKAPDTRYALYLSRLQSTLCTHDGVLNQLTVQQACTLVRRMTTKTRSEFEALLRNELRSIDMQDIEVQEIMRLLSQNFLCLDVKDWQPAETLSEYTESYFLKNSAQNEKVRLPKGRFNARAFQEVAGINVRWTSHLNKHLEVGDNDAEVSVFHMESVLDLYENSPTIKVLPPEFIKETRRTLALLLPFTDTKVRRWLTKERRECGIDPGLDKLPHLEASARNLAAFHHWQERLAVLKDVYDETEPTGILQFWRDDRRAMQWWTFWVAAVAFVLSIIACVEGAMQVYKSYYPSAL